MELAGLASALVLGACATSVQWASRSEEVREALRYAGDDHACNVLVADGVEGEDPCEAACALARLHEGRTVLCVAGAAGHARASAACGVTAAVEPRGLVRLLVALRAEELKAAAGGDGRACASEAGRACGGTHASPPACPGWAPRESGRSPRPQAADGPMAPAAHEAPSESVSPSAAASRQVRSQGGVPSQECEEAGAPPLDIDSIKEPVVLAPVVHLSQEVECQVAGMDAPVPTVCFASARGGVGKSALAVVSALALARRGLNVALVDLDFQFGTCLGYLGSGETDGLIDVACPGKALSVDARTLARCRCTPCRGLAAYEFCRMPEQAELLFGAAGQLVRAARAGCDVALVDLPAGVNETVAQAIELADRCLFVADQGALSLESLGAQQALCARLGIPRTKLVTVMNRCDPRHRDEGFLQRVSFETQAPQVVRVLDGGAEVTQMLSIGHAADLFGIQNKFATSVEELMAHVCCALGIQGFDGDAWVPRSPAAPKASPGRGRKRKAKPGQMEDVPCPF